MSESVVIEVKIGGTQINYQGPIDFLENGFVSVCERLISVSPSLPDGSQPSTTDRPNKSGLFEFTMKTMASKLDARSGPEMVLCAIAKHHFVDGNERVTVDQIRMSMKEVPARFKPSMSKNLIAHLERMMKSGKVTEVSTGVYALTDGQIREIELRLKS